ncbi:glutamate--tRNA ligase family protein [Sulfurospirillum sp.]|nr:glutamate--tRNA ligase family protein [Sulfurospirillum sp.]
MYRFAPSPTGDLHISNLRVALFNYIRAKQSGDMFIVRIEDSDKAKNIDGKDQEILDILAIFGITYDNLYYQSENFKYHLQFASSLMSKGKAFACFCSENKLEDGKCASNCINISQQELLNNNLPFTIRVKSDDVDDFVIMKKDKYPTYNFACATDDMLQGIKTIIREENHISNTPKQELVRTLLGYEEKIQYIHIPEISNVKDNENNVKWLLDQGYMPEAIINYLILLENEVPNEIFSLAEAISWFDLKNISKVPAKFNIDKLKFLNKEHIKLVEDVELSKRIGYSCASIGKLAKLYTEEVNTTFEIKEKIDLLFSQKKSDEYQESLDKLKTIVKDAPYFENFEEFTKYVDEKSNLKGIKLLNTLQILLIGEESGPELKKVYPLIKNYLQEIAR